MVINEDNVIRFCNNSIRCAGLTKPKRSNSTGVTITTTATTSTTTTSKAGVTLCGETVCGAAHGDITHKPMRDVTLVRRCRFYRTVPQLAAPDRRTATSDRVSWENTHSSMHVITPDGRAASGAPLLQDV
ncbi:hypothetical protein E2C01_034151 [Portunus trituberculatus]|uniref:Uncharacterized protein n=1 Tax=Portunus trituberculatus TaxID=210409 RepID=A0A5B7F5N8_PORTR|nr:hypothetical protein [Portunus trituberculatus]